MKLRWNRRNNGECDEDEPDEWDDVSQADDNSDHNETMSDNACQDRTYAINTVNNTADLRYLRPTDLCFNKRNELPKKLQHTKEVQLQHLGHNLLQTTATYIAEQDRKSRNSTVKYSNLTKEENLGLSSVQKRKDTVIFQTDKSGRFSMDSVDNYKQACEPHIEADEIITEKHHLELQNQANAHSTFWTRILQAGFEVDNDNGKFHAHDRIKKNMLSHDSAVAPLYVLRKDHKHCENENSGPPTRPVCGADVAYNKRLSHLLSMIIKPIWCNNTNTCTSTEDMMASLKTVNDRLSETREDVVIISLDVKALYPSIDVDMAADIASKMFLEKGPTVSGIDARELGLYLAVNYDKERHLLDAMGFGPYCHTRRRYIGRPPTLTGCANSTNEDEKLKSWRLPQRKPDEMTTRLMLAEALKIAILFVMKNHVYRCGEEIRKQSKGGPIGLELTGDLAQILMIWFDEQLQQRIRQEGHEPIMYKRYVDDITNILRNDWKQEGEQGRDDVRALECILRIGNGIHESLQLTGDAPSMHENGKMPTLDLSLWTNNEVVGVEEKCIVMHEFYAKGVSAKYMTHARSAMPPAMKRTVLTQELLRVMLRCSPRLGWDNVVDHLNSMMKRMQFSGHNQTYRAQILKSALAAYDKIVRKDAEGIEPMYRPKDWNRETREEDKQKKRENWFKRGGAETVIFVPNTPNSELKKRYQKEIQEACIKVKVVETTGRSLKSILQRSNPLSDRECNPPPPTRSNEHNECPVCISGNAKCRKEGVTYEIQCVQCGDVYVGETADNAYHRGKQHAAALRNSTADSALVKHIRIKHQNDDPPPAFNMKVTGVFGNDALLRQVTEASRINQASDAGICMNSRAEYNHQAIPRVILRDD